MICKIIKHFPNTNNWNVGDVVDVTNPVTLLEQGLIEEYTSPVEKEEEVIEKVEELIEIKPKISEKKTRRARNIWGGYR